MHHLHTFHGDPELGSRPLKEWPCSPDRAIELLKTLYDSDKPFFTKKNLRAVSNQLNRRYNTRKKNSEQKQLVSVKGLSGSTIYYQVITGRVLIGAGKNEDWEMEEPKIRYLCYEQLTSSVKLGSIELVEAFFPLQIEHFMLTRASDTKLPISTEYIENPVPVDVTLRNILDIWKHTTEFQKLESLLKLVTPRKVTKIVGIASGSMEFGPDDEDCTYRSAMQHSMMITIKESIGKMTDKKIKCYAQDPRYTAVDTWALAEYNCEVLKDPKALLEIDDDCILFSCCPALPLKEITVDFARPAMLIWDRVVDEPNHGRHNPNSTRVQNMIRNEYVCHEFWDLREIGTAPFRSDLVAYIRRQAE
ncbi:hypothetical protein CBS147332_4932 [Penicillium roqueforti]|nr:hypothetical protein CBS147332_4932 [Penicillium roqueforti]KAI3104619.1 hypothetical protein CBS147331_7200 [Penicillium roqueforti]